MSGHVPARNRNLSQTSRTVPIPNPNPPIPVFLNKENVTAQPRPARRNIMNSKSNLNLNRNDSLSQSKSKPVNVHHISSANTLNRNGRVAVTNGELLALARGKPLKRASVSHFRDGDTGAISRLLQHRTQLESDLFKLPTNPRSLEQRKKKQHLEQTIREIESQIDALKRR
mmetsp:Transcript_65531/g.58809  ORF Transcript_65531/g.58809 Transcript_65531/m.58809 type:complete len:171 (-) Transcript_65531:267-779(-)